TPLASAAVVGVMLNAMSVHWPKVWVTQGGLEYALVLAVVGASIGFTGPGAFSLDHLAGWSLAGNGWGLVVLAGGVASAAATLAAKRAGRATPAGTEASEEPVEQRRAA